jgi:chaperonin cofactor prefoldin
MSLEGKLQEASQDFQKLQVDLSNAIEARQQLDAQLAENELVKKAKTFLISIFLDTHFNSSKFRNLVN